MNKNNLFKNLEYENRNTLPPVGYEPVKHPVWGFLYFIIIHNTKILTFIYI